MSDPVSAAAVLGFVLGIQHATDPDHLVAVATIVSRERRSPTARSSACCGASVTRSRSEGLALALRLRRARRLRAFGAGVGSIAFGIVYAIRVL